MYKNYLISFVLLLTTVFITNSARAFACQQSIERSQSLRKSTVVSYNMSIVPVIATNDKTVIMAWHSFSLRRIPHVQFRLVKNGCLSKIFTLNDKYTNSRHPKVVPLKNSFALTFQVLKSNAKKDLHLIIINKEGEITSHKIITNNSRFYNNSITSNSLGSLAIAWNTSSTFRYTLLTKEETVLNKKINLNLKNQTSTNIPQLALDDNNNLYLAYSEGKMPAHSWDIFVAYKPAKKHFVIPVAIYKSLNLMSSDVKILINKNNMAELIWVEELPSIEGIFELFHTTLNNDLTPVRTTQLSHLGTSSWTPSIINSKLITWDQGIDFYGQLYLIDDFQINTNYAKPQKVFPNIIAAFFQAVKDSQDNQHFIFCENYNHLRRIHYAWR